MIGAWVVESDNFEGNNLVAFFLQLKLSIKTYLVSMANTWLSIANILSLGTRYIGNKRTYLWRKLLISVNYSNNGHKEENLTIKNSGLLRLGRKESSTNCHSEANIIANKDCKNYAMINNENFKTMKE